MTVWRIKLNSMRSEEDGGAPGWDETKDFCRRKGLVGTGWGASALRDGARLETVIKRYREIGWTTGAQLARVLAEEVQEGDLVWTRTTLGEYFLGQIVGPWRYDTSDDSKKYDLYNLRPTKWLKEGFRDYEVPGAVVRSFIGRARTLVRIGDHSTAIRVTEMMWEAATKGAQTIERTAPQDVITDLLDPTDVEDLVLLYLQSRGWILLPSSRTRSTPVYEAALIGKDGTPAVVSVKSGRDNAVPLRDLAKAAGAAHAFAYSTHESYRGKADGITSN
jgi:hypothetical protein